MKKTKKLKDVLKRALLNQSLGFEEISFLLSQRDAGNIELLFDAARCVRNRFFGTRVFLYGFLYFNTDCCNDCTFCKYRTSNTTLRRYRKSSAEVQDAVSAIVESGVHLVDLTMGEISSNQHEAEIEYKRLSAFVRLVRKESNVPVMVSPGVVPCSVLQELAAAGASWYACYQETYNRALFSKTRIRQSFSARVRAKRQAQASGMLIEEGMLIGIGETIDDLTENIIAMRDLEADQVRVMTFIPQKGTPMARWEPQDHLQELITIAVLRLAMPDRLIPASLDVGGLDGLQRRLNSGANVVTSLMVPSQGLAGVANQKLDIEQARRTPDAIRPVLTSCGLEAATLDEYRNWLSIRKEKYPAALCAEKVA